MKAYVISDFESNRKKKLVCNLLKRQGAEIINPSFEKGKSLFYLVNEAAEQELIKNSEGIMVVVYNHSFEDTPEINMIATKLEKNIKHFSFYNGKFIKVYEESN